MLSGKWEQIPAGKGMIGTMENDWNDGMILRFQRKTLELPGSCSSREFKGVAGGGDWEGAAMAWRWQLEFWDH